MSDTLAAELQRIALWHRKSAEIHSAKAGLLLAQHESATIPETRAAGHRAFAETCDKAALALAGAKTHRLAAGEPSEAFTTFWTAFPSRRKRDLPGCIALWKQKKLDPLLSDVLAGLERAKRSVEWKKESGEFIPGPHPWLKREGWHDEMTLHPSEHLNGNGAEPFGWRVFLKENPQYPETTHHYAQGFVKKHFGEWTKEK